MCELQGGSKFAEVFRLFRVFSAEKIFKNKEIVQESLILPIVIVWKRNNRRKMNFHFKNFGTSYENEHSRRISTEILIRLECRPKRKRCILNCLQTFLRKFSGIPNISAGYIDFKHKKIDALTSAIFVGHFEFF